MRGGGGSLCLRTQSLRGGRRGAAAAAAAGLGRGNESLAQKIQIQMMITAAAVNETDGPPRFPKTRPREKGALFSRFLQRLRRASAIGGRVQKTIDGD